MTGQKKDAANGGSKNPKKAKVSLLRVTFLSAVGAVLMACVFGVLWLSEIGIFRISEASFGPLLNHRQVDNTVVFDRHNDKIGEIFNRYHVYVQYSDLPKDLVNAILAIEDRSFFQHRGVDIRGIARAAYDRLRGGKVSQGASTITQQVVRHFLLTKEKTIERKLKEAVLAIKLERMISKERIFELYANVMFLGNGSYGVGAAAQRYFGKELGQLQTHEFALIAGLFQSPSRYNPQKYPKRARFRQKQVLTAMLQSNMVSEADWQKLARLPLNYKEYRPLNQEFAPYFVDHVAERARQILGGTILNKGLRIYTTLDPKLQQMAQESLSERTDVFQKAKNLVLIPYESRKKSPAIQGAIISSNPKTGEILAMVGGRDYDRTKFNRTIHAKRQPGSAFKPIIYSLALSKGFKWSDLIYVSPVAVKNYRPKNFSRQFLTETTLLRAFYLSINTPAVEVGAQLGLQNVLDHAKRLGVETELKQETGSLLGGSEVTMSDLLRVYSTIVNKGVRVSQYAIARIEDSEGKILYQVPSVEERSKEVLSEQDAFLMVQGMRAVFYNGTAYAENDLGHFAAGKTGTSNDSRDNWFVGASPEVATAVWVGSDRSFEFLSAATGTSLALPIWATYMRKAFSVYKPTPFTMPPGIVKERVHSKYGYKTSAGLTMYFKKGQEPLRDSSDLKVLSETGKFRTLFEN